MPRTKRTRSAGGKPRAAESERLLRFGALGERDTSGALERTSGRETFVYDTLGGRATSIGAPVSVCIEALVFGEPR